MLDFNGRRFPQGGSRDWLRQLLPGHDKADEALGCLVRFTFSKGLTRFRDRALIAGVVTVETKPKDKI